MKSTGIIRRVDHLGRVVIPKELRRMLNIENKNPLEIHMDYEKIVFEKYKPGMQCVVTGEVDEDNIVLVGGQIILSVDGSEQLLKEIDDLKQKGWKS